MTEEQAIIEAILQWHAVARREGLLALAEHIDSAPDPFARQAIGLLAEGASPQVLRASLEVEALREAVLKAMVIEGAAGIANGENQSRLEARLQRLALGF
ncbi:MAG: hypothetical protein KGL42_08835 [Betaproteobacteria bacterium]|nr:hypothetical protein [Betaproteobacteria bacterium]